MDIAELMVERFLGGNGRAFVCSQYELRGSDSWSASIDFVTLDFSVNPPQIVVVEVSEGGGLGSVGYKADKCANAEYFGLLAQQLSAQTGGLTADWPIAFLGFLKDQSLVDEAYKTFAKHENIFFRPFRDTIEDYWNTRACGLLPKRPYPVGVDCVGE